MTLFDRIKAGEYCGSIDPGFHERNFFVEVKGVRLLAGDIEHVISAGITLADIANLPEWGDITFGVSAYRGDTGMTLCSSCLACLKNGDSSSHILCSLRVMNYASRDLLKMVS